VLADFEIRKANDDSYLTIAPWREEQLQPVSYDLLLSEEIRASIAAFGPGVGLIDPKGLSDRTDALRPGDGEYLNPGIIHPDKGYRIAPGEFMLACTEEVVTLSPHMAARVEGKSSLGRLGIQVHITAGFIDPGFSGQITLEIANVAPWAMMLYTGMPIAQIVLTPVSTPERDYTQTGHYNGQRGPTESRYRL
jgi:dCTP deaminase